MNRRRFAAWCATGAALPLGAAAAAVADTTTLALAWRGPREDDAHHAGWMHIDWAAGRIRLLRAVQLPGRPHGLLLEDDGSLLVVAVRPGRWLMRIDPRGAIERRVSLEDEPDGHRLDGHAIVGSDAATVLTTQTDARSGAGFVAVRDRRTLATVARWSSHGIDPHQLLLDGDGALVVANGGIPRDAAGHKRELHRMRPSLTRLDARDGRWLGQWSLDDPRLSLRHLAWSDAGAGRPRTLGIALQAEHDDAAQREQAPLLALWNGEALLPASAPAGGSGYAGDIAATGDGGFVLSAQRANRVLYWRPGNDHAWVPAGQLTDPCALGALPDPDAARVFAGARGIGRWHPQRPAAMLPWPMPMAVDNHCIVIGNGATA